MKVYQSKLTLGNEGKILIDSTNKKSNSSTTKSKKKSENLENHSSKRKDGIYTDPPNPSKKRKFIDSSTQTELSRSNSDVKNDSQKVIDMMTSETPSSEYWEALAKNRKCSLEDALEENRFLKDENEYLKGENKCLEEMLEEAKQLALLIQSVTGGEDSSAVRVSDNRDENEAEEIQNEDDNTEATSD